MTLPSKYTFAFCQNRESKGVCFQSVLDYSRDLSQHDRYAITKYLDRPSGPCPQGEECY